MIVQLSEHDLCLLMCSFACGLLHPFADFSTLLAWFVLNSEASEDELRAQKAAVPERLTDGDHSWPAEVLDIEKVINTIKMCPFEVIF